MDADRARLVRELLQGSEWVARTGDLARTVRRATRLPSGLLVVGTPEDEPWHMTAHLADEARFAGTVELEPTLVRWSVPPGAPPHLAVALDRLGDARRGETLLVVAEQASPPDLLERVSDVRRRGATVVAVEGGDPELEGLAHEAVRVPPVQAAVPDAFDAAQHLVSLAVGEEARTPRGLRGRLARWLEVVSGPDASSR